MKRIEFLHKYKYEILLVALLQHLFAGIFFANTGIYSRVAWLISMVLLGVASFGVFYEKGKTKNRIRNILFLLVFLLPLIFPAVGNVSFFMRLVSFVYVLYFGFIFWELIKFLLKPGYINNDIIFASVCGFLLLLEVSVFLMQLMFYNNPASFRGVDNTSLTTIFIDFVYFCSVVLTTIGFGDITPAAPHTKLLTSFIGIVGQLYIVVLVGILISKFSSQSEK